MKLLLATILASSAMAFTVVVPSMTSRKTVSTSTSTSQLFIEKWVADMIDNELFREQHKDDYERAWMEKNRAAVLQGFQPSNDSNLLATMDMDGSDARQKLKDSKLARENPQQYCADRCVATGHCDVYEDIFEFSPEEVMAFCTDCVLADDDEPCDIPDAFYELDRLKP